MSYRIGIGIGDVVEREGDLLGDGVNIAARLEGLAEAGGICISRAVHEQVTNKLSARFVDIGARKVKNIPEPVHAYLVVTWDDGRTFAKPQATATPASARSAKKWLSVAVIGAIALCTAAFAFLSATQRPDSKALSNSTAAVTCRRRRRPHLHHRQHLRHHHHLRHHQRPSQPSVAPIRLETNRRLQSVPFNPAAILRLNAVGVAMKRAERQTLSPHARKAKLIEIDACLRVPSNGGARQSER